GSLTFTGGEGPTITADQVGEVTDRLACCGRVDIALNFDIDESGSVNGSDRLDLHANASGGLMAWDMLGGGARLDTGTLPTHDGTDIPDTEGLAATAQIVGGEATAVQVGITSGSGMPVFNNVTITGNLVADEVLQQSITIRLERGSTLTAGETYYCHESASD